MSEFCERFTSVPRVTILEQAVELATAGRIEIGSGSREFGHSSFEEPHQLATGMKHVFVNGVQVLRDGEHTGALPGRLLR